MTDKNKEALDALQMVCDAFKEIKVYGVDELIGKIRSALSAPAAPVIEGLVAALSSDLWTETSNEYLPSEERDKAEKHAAIIEKAARAYAALPKMQKVDLDGMKYIEPLFAADPKSARHYNAAIDDIKAKYGELYAEVKE